MDLVVSPGWETSGGLTYRDTVFVLHFVHTFDRVQMNKTCHYRHFTIRHFCILLYANKLLCLQCCALAVI